MSGKEYNTPQTEKLIMRVVIFFVQRIHFWGKQYGEGRLEGFRQISSYLPEEFRQISSCFPEKFRQITSSFLEGHQLICTTISVLVRLSLPVAMRSRCLRARPTILYGKPLTTQ